MNIIIPEDENIENIVLDLRDVVKRNWTLKVEEMLPELVLIIPRKNVSLNGIEGNPMDNANFVLNLEKAIRSYMSSISDIKQQGKVLNLQRLDQIIYNIKNSKGCKIIKINSQQEEIEIKGKNDVLYVFVDDASIIGAKPYKSLQVVYSNKVVTNKEELSKLKNDNVNVVTFADSMFRNKLFENGKVLEVETPAPKKQEPNLLTKVTNNSKHKNDTQINL